MPTKHRRVQVLLDPDDFAVVRDLARATRLSMSRICADVVGEAVPIMARSLAMLEDAARLTEEAKAQLRYDLRREERIAERAKVQAWGALAAAEAAIAKAGRGRAAAAPTRPKGGVGRRSSSPPE
jgi:hypothetical protein